jgi:hypothetical protein
MRSSRVVLWFIASILVLLFSSAAGAATYQVSWSPVTQYTDGTAIESSKTVMYTVYWSTDSTLSAGLKLLTTATTATSVSFDPAVAGMPRGSTVYFTAKSVLSTGEESNLASPALQWIYPLSNGKKPKSPNNVKLINN